MAEPLRWTSHADLQIDRRPSVRREAYLDYMTFRSTGPVLFTEIFGPLLGLKEQWHAQGADARELDFSAFRYRCAERGWLPVITGRFGCRPDELIEQTDEHIITRDGLGRRMKQVKGVATLPLPLDYPVADMDDWRAVKHHYEFTPDRLGADWRRIAEDHLREGRVVTVGIPGGFDEPRQLMGEEALCIAYFDQPELVHDMLTTLADTACAVLEAVTAEVTVDVLFVHEDMAGKSGPLAGPAQVREFIAPYYRRVWELAADRGVRLFDQDSDGNMNAVIGEFLAAGVNCMHPFEPAAGMDVVATREQFGRGLAIYGGIDKHILRRSPEEIEAELRRVIPPMVETGGYEIALDHRIPNGTPLKNYRFYVDSVWHILAELGCA
jgi:hypothetical protein